MGCNCGKPKCDGHCGVSPAVLQINNPSECVLFRKVEVPASMGTSVENPPKPGAYRNVLLYYNADGEAYLYSSDGIPTKVTGTTSNYEILTNKPKINGVELVGDKSLADIGVTDAIDSALENYTPTSGFAEVAFSGDYNDLSNKPTIGNATLTIQKNGTAVDTFTANATSNKTINITVPTTAADVSALPASTKYGASISVSLNTTDYKMTTTLNDQDGNTLGTAQTVDLPLESVVVNGSYDNTNKKIVLTLQNGNTVDIPVGDLVAGLQTEITSTNKLSSDLVDDTNHTNKFVTAAQIAKLNGIAAGAEVNVQSDWSVTDTTSDAFIKNKPTIPAAQVNSDWNASSGVAQILNKPTLAAVATSGDYNDLSNKPTIPAAQVNSDWNAASGVAQILNKPSLATVATSGSYNDLTNKPTIPTVNNATLTIQKNGTDVQTFTANQSTNATANITVPTKTSDLTNDGATGTSVYIEESDIAPSELSGEGEFVTLEGTTDCSALDTQLNGNAEQTTYSGKNLLPPTADWTQTINGVTIKVEGGVYTFSGTSTSGGTSDTWKPVIAPYTIQAGDYYHLGNEFVNDQIQINIYFSDGTMQNAAFGAMKRIYDLSAHAGKTISQLRIYWNAGNTFNGVAKPMILHNVSTTAGYEPYVGGIPAPNPQFPMPISTVTGAQTITVTGKNLIGLQDDTLTSNGVNFAINNGIITAGGTTTATSNAENDNIIGDLSRNGNYPVYATITEANSIELRAGTYTVSAEITKTGDTSAGIAFGTGATMGARITGLTKLEVLISDATGTYTKTATFTIAEGERLYVSTYYEGNATKKNVGFTISNIQLELGSTATAYEPYQGQSHEINLGKNLFDKGNANILGAFIGGATPHTISMDGANTSVYIPCQPNITYTISKVADNVFRAGTTAETPASGVVVNDYVDNASGTSITLTPSSNARYLVVFLRNTSSSHTQADLLASLQIEQGTQATSYSEYFTPLELAKVGNYQDRIYKDEGKWYIEKQVGKVVLIGANSENWQYANGVCYTDSITDYSRSNNKPLIDNFTTTVNVASAGSVADNTSAFGAANLGTQSRFYVKYTSLFSSAATIKTWLGTHNTTVYYALATPTTTEITNEALIGQLEALADALGYDGVTNIISTSPGLPAILSVSTYTGSAIPSATRIRAGIVRIGDGIDVDDCGTISVNAQKAPTAFTMQYADNLAGWQSGDNYELVKETTGTPTDYIYRANKSYYGGTGVSFLNEKTGVTFTPQELYAWLLDGNEAVLNHVPLGWAVDNGAEVLYAGNYIDGIWLKRETIASQSGNMISFNGSAFVTALIPRTSSYEETVQDTLGIAISGYENDGAMVYDLISIDGFSLYGSVQESSPII